MIPRCGQFRMHDCTDCVVYLNCGSRGVVEGVRGIRVAPFVGFGEDSGGGGEGQEVVFEEKEVQVQRTNKWDQIDDFMWPGAGAGGKQSPNWSVLPEGERVGGNVWRKVLEEVGKGGTGGGGGGHEDEEEKEERQRVVIEGLLRSVGVKI